MICALYLRLSREDAVKPEPESESIQNQRALLLRYARERRWEVYEIYCDEDRSGADAERPDFLRMLRDAEERKFSVLLCKSQSRFTRDMELVERYIHGLFPLWGVRFIAVADNTDTDERGSKKMRQINGLVNEWYLEDLSENVRMVLNEKRRQGRYIGSSPVSGYLRDPSDSGKLTLDFERAGLVRRMFDMALSGMSCTAIARELNRENILSPAAYKRANGLPCPKEGGEWSHTSVKRILTNEMYLGSMVQGRRRKLSYKSKVMVNIPEYQWYRVENTHTALIDSESFIAVQRMLRTDAGFFRCLDCGHDMHLNSNGSIEYLRCRRHGKENGYTVRLDELMSALNDRAAERTGVDAAPQTVMEYVEIGRRDDGKQQVVIHWAV